MFFKRCDASDVVKNTEAFSDLFIRVYNVSFPDGVFTNAFGHERVKDLLSFVNDNTAILYGAFQDDKLAGFIWGYRRQVNDELRIHVPVLVVGEHYQRKGAARKLMELMKCYSNDNGIRIIEVMVTSTNEDALKYYANARFKEARKLLELSIGHDD